jgi:uncharacterized repeat protein (TIGR03803 family)
MKTRISSAVTTASLLLTLSGGVVAQTPQTVPGPVSYSYSVLYTFTGGADGGLPQGRGLVRDAGGNIYGTTASGGDLSVNCIYGPGCGVVFKLDPFGKLTVLHAFTGGADGGIYFSSPALVLEGAGNLYGTTTAAARPGSAWSSS